jgi:hypothetical protein
MTSIVTLVWDIIGNVISSGITIHLGCKTRQKYKEITLPKIGGSPEETYCVWALFVLVAVKIRLLFIFLNQIIRIIEVILNSSIKYFEINNFHERIG